MKILVELLLLGVFIVMAAPYSENFQATQAVSSNPSTIVVEVESSGNGARYKIDSKPVADPLRALGLLVGKRGEYCPVIVLLNWDASLKQVYDVEIIASKAGFKTIRPFVVKNGFMSEIKFGPDIRFSTNPANPE
jgi:hypothetical protein